MIELTQGRSVKWKSKGAWHTGYVMMRGKSIAVALWGPKLLIIRDSCTSKVFLVKPSMLKDNDFRKEEKRMESEAAKCES